MKQDRVSFFFSFCLLCTILTRVIFTVGTSQKMFEKFLLKIDTTCKFLGNLFEQTASHLDFKGQGVILHFNFYKVLGSWLQKQ